MEGFWEATLDGELTERKVSEPKHLLLWDTSAFWRLVQKTLIYLSVCLCFFVGPHFW